MPLCFLGTLRPTANFRVMKIGAVCLAMSESVVWLAMTTRRAEIVLYNVSDFRRVAHPAPNHAQRGFRPQIDHDLPNSIQSR